MPCKLDVREAILQKAYKEVGGRVAGDAILEVSSIEAGQKMLAQLRGSFRGHVTGYTSTHNSRYDPKYIFLEVSQEYINYEYGKLPKDQQNDPGDNERSEDLFDAQTEDEQSIKSVFTKYVEFKRSLLNQYKDRLANIKNKKKERGITTERLNQLNKEERDYELIIKGNYELKIKGLEQ